MWISDLIQSGTREEQKKKLVMVYAVIVTLFVLVAAIITLCVTSLVLSTKDSNADTSVNTNDEEENEDPSGIPSGYVEKTFDNSQLYSGTLILVNEANPINASCNHSFSLLTGAKSRPKTPSGSNSYTVGNTPQDRSSFGGTSEAIDALNSMLGDYYSNKADDNIIIDSAHYDGIESTSIYASGLAFKLTYFVDYANQPSLKASIYGINKYNWIYENAYKYGFVALGSGDTDDNSNVFRYVGIAHATAMKQKKFTNLESYLDYLKSGTSVSKGITVSTEDGKIRIFYCAANAVAYVSEKNTYTVSGNNYDGYIIAVNTSAKAEDTADTTQAQ